MSYRQSALSSNVPTNDFDYVVAVTEASVNAALAEYLSSDGFQHENPLVDLYFVYPKVTKGGQNVQVDRNPVAIDRDSLLAKANGTDPFTVPDGTDSDDPGVQSLQQAGFAFAVRARLGIPSVYQGAAAPPLPPLVVLKPGSSSVTYRMTFAEFTMTTLAYGPWGAQWVSLSQPDSQPWTLVGDVNLDLQAAAAREVPQDVLNTLKALSDDPFSIQELYLNLNSFALEGVFAFDDSRVPKGAPISTFMNSNFVASYLAGGAQSNVLLGYAVKHEPDAERPSIAVTDVNHFAPNSTGAAPRMLNYLCATNGHQLPGISYANFGWNWLEAGEAQDRDGVLALNRRTFAEYLDRSANGGSSLADYVAANCYQPHVKLGTHLAEATFAKPKMTPGQQPTRTIPASGDTLLAYSFAAQDSDRAGSNGALGEMKLSTTYDLQVTVQRDPGLSAASPATRIVVTQHLLAALYTRKLRTEARANVVDKTITDTYTIGVNAAGHIELSGPVSQIVDNSKNPKANGFLNFWSDVQSVSDMAAACVSACVATSFHDVRLAALQTFVFPGGKTFMFSDVGYSDTRDLVAHITYRDPS
ncbi:hypothetical protein [Frankia sp. QA3]|uniref:hypothetical protein n=1 Tax=Frankia sp. QA3 TaxID=710111 RepID=UPI000269C2B1|nr:hypothetical protein [Frankia sp. QA3]EIV91031.1 hypothetical protein FraQA3DRAFT_0450 [Frankia sp. QA3]